MSRRRKGSLFSRMVELVIELVVYAKAPKSPKATSSVHQHHRQFTISDPEEQSHHSFASADRASVSSTANNTAHYSSPTSFTQRRSNGHSTYHRQKRQSETRFRKNSSSSSSPNLILSGHSATANGYITPRRPTLSESGALQNGHSKPSYNNLP